MFRNVLNSGDDFGSKKMVSNLRYFEKNYLTTTSTVHLIKHRRFLSVCNFLILAENFAKQKC